MMARKTLRGQNSWVKQLGSRRAVMTETLAWIKQEEEDNRRGSQIPIPPPPNLSILWTRPQRVEFAAGLRELFTRLEPIVGFFVTLQGLFPLTTLWNGEAFGKPGDYTTCY